MKPKPEPGQDESLNELLRTWVVKEPLPPRFQARVWERIAQAERTAEQPAWAVLVRLVEVVLPRPGVAAAYLALLLAVGVAAGSWAAQRESSRLEQALGSRYIQSLDPYHSAGTK